MCKGQDIGNAKVIHLDNLMRGSTGAEMSETSG